MIVTVTLNAALDRTLTVPNFQSGVRNRASEALSLPGGKGVNVARALKRLGEPVIATGLAGGRTGGTIIEGLTAEGILNDFVRIRDESRTSTAVIDPNAGQTEIIEYGPSVAPEELAMMLEKIRFLARGADFFVIAGSLPRDVPPDFYAEVLRELKGKVTTAVDVQGTPLRSVLAAEPALVSPNAREAEEIVGYEFSEDADLAVAAQTLTSMGATGVLVHQADGCMARLRAAPGKEYRTLRAHLPTREALTTVGSGDALLAGYIAGLVRGEDMEARLSLAVACGAANTMTPGAGVFDLGDVESLRRRVRIWDASAPPSEGGDPT
jgi:1-phosphofructokinase family hexose kinase